MQSHTIDILKSGRHSGIKNHSITQNFHYKSLKLVSATFHFFTKR